MAERPATWYSLNGGPTNSPANLKTPDQKKRKTKPPNLKLDEQSILSTHKEYSIHPNLRHHRSPPFSPKSPLTSDSVHHYSSEGTASPLSPYKDTTSCSPEDPSSPRSLSNGWQQQPKKRSLTPIPEMKLNDKMLNLNVDHNKLKGKPDFIREIDVPDFNLDDIKVIVGRNKIRIIGEQNARVDLPKVGNNKTQRKEIHKVVNIPSHIDPQSIKVMKQRSQIIIHGYQPHPSPPAQIRSSSSVCENGFLRTQDNGSVRVTINVPKSYDPHRVQLQTFTRHYLVVTAPCVENQLENHLTGNDGSQHVASHSQDQAMSHSGHRQRDFVETFELPHQPNAAQITTKVLGQNTVIVEVPLGFRERKSTM